MKTDRIGNCLDRVEDYFLFTKPGPVCDQFHTHDTNIASAYLPRQFVKIRQRDCVCTLSFLRRSAERLVCIIMCVPYRKKRHLNVLKTLPGM